LILVVVGGGGNSDYKATSVAIAIASLTELGNNIVYLTFSVSIANY
jgi:hypothetical protein